jgi:hypothetical protein
MTSWTRTRRILIPVVLVAVASAAFAVVMMTSRPASSAMSGMNMSGSTPAPADHGEMPGMDMSGSTPAPTPTMDPDMPGMDMPDSAPAPAPTPTMDPDMPGMDMSGGHPAATPTMDPDMPGMSHEEHGEAAGAAADRPLAPVLGTFGGGSAAVLITAGMLRRKDRAANLARKAARDAARGQK